MNVSKKKLVQPVPPEKGSFPLDHLAECKNIMQEYLDCLKENGNVSLKCRDQSKKYIQCRMENQLMTQDELKNLGYYDDATEEKLKNVKLDGITSDRQKSGFVAGENLKREKK
eukprot:TRINITY_DN6533_c0_g1_i1.p1 TRINITY_DN6533_c0_g1~~TRINITY_DN6533_c0_g1_i1.p1  ORF type:complete len:113 (+),score=35.95 TRINITY_DN6533_c0_g1_i1:130-468(+)